MIHRPAREPQKKSNRLFGGIDRILVALDGSQLAEQVLPHAIVVAKAFDAETVLLRVVGNGGGASRRERLDAAGWRLERLEAERYLEEVAARLEAAGIEVEHRTAVGNPAKQILAAVRDERADLLLLTSHGEGGISEFRVSSTAAKVIASAECSVLLVPALETAEMSEETSKYTRIVVPVDGSARSDWAALQAACIAQGSEAELVLVHVVRHPELVGEMSPGGEAHKLAERLVELNAAAARDHLERQRKSFAAAGLSVRYRVEANANIPEIIARVVEEEQASLVVASAHGHSAGAVWPYGGCAGTLLTYASRPILVLQDLPQRPLSRMRSRAAESAEPAARQPV